MTVKFKFDYVLNLHDKYIYIRTIESDGVKAGNAAFKKSLVQVNRLEIKSIIKNTDGTATIMYKNGKSPLKTIEKYNDVIDTIKRANLALNIMDSEKIYLFDDFEVNTDELCVVDGWSDLKSMAIRDIEEK